MRAWLQSKLLMLRNITVLFASNTQPMLFHQIHKDDQCFGHWTPTCFSSKAFHDGVGWQLDFSSSTIFRGYYCQNFSLFFLFNKAWWPPSLHPREVQVQCLRKETKHSRRAGTSHGSERNPLAYEITNLLTSNGQRSNLDLKSSASAKPISTEKRTC